MALIPLFIRAIAASYLSADGLRALNYPPGPDPLNHVSGGLCRAPSLRRFSVRDMSRASLREAEANTCAPAASASQTS